VPVSDIADFELSLFDTQGAAQTGYGGEFLCSSRLDNLASCFTALEAICIHAGGAQEDPDVSVVALFDHEETP
ncbi:peptidase M18, partial [Ochromonadaceae sp. CCMP2298]